MGEDNKQIITPPNLLKSKVGPGKGIDPELVARAELAVAGMKSDYEKWVQDDITRLRDACNRIVSDTAGRKKHLIDLFQISHDMKGQGGSFGYPLITRFCNSLCNFVEERADVGDKEISVIRAHVDSVAAVISQKIEADGGKLGQAIANGLEAAVAKYKG